MIMSLHIPHWGDSIDNLVTDVRPHCLCYSNALTAPARAQNVYLSLKSACGEGRGRGTLVTTTVRWPQGYRADQMGREFLGH